MKRVPLFALFLAVFPALPSLAGIGDFFKAVGETAINTVTAPAQTIIKAAQVVTNNAPPSAILDPAKNLAGSTGQVIGNGASLAAFPQQEVYKKAQELAAQTGPGGAFVFDVATFATRYNNELQLTQAQAAANILQGKNLLQLVSTPLAAAIREARQRHASNAHELPADVKAGLAPYFEPAILSRARWTVGKVEITLPNGIGQTRKFGDEGYAVVADDIIVFNEQPPAFEDNPFWWGHEVTHVEQYARLGVEEFSRIYVFSGGADLENPADDRGRQVLQRSSQSGLATTKAMSVRLPQPTANQPLYPTIPQSSQGQGNNIMPPPGPMTDPAIVQCVFPNDPRPFNFLGTQAGRIIVVDRFSGQWLHIGFALPPQIPGPAWHYSTGDVFYDVFPNGDIVQRVTPFGPQKVGYVIRLR